MNLHHYRDTETARALLTAHRSAILTGVWNQAACAGAVLYTALGSAADAIVLLPTDEQDPALRAHYAAVRDYLRRVLSEQEAKLTERSGRVERLLGMVRAPGSETRNRHGFRVVNGGNVK
jgi:hypothetical protein